MAARMRRSAAARASTPSPASAPAALLATASFARGDGFIPIVAEPARRRRPPLALSRRPASPCAPSRRSRPDVELQANLAGFSDRRERGTAFSAITAQGADASLRLVGRGALPFAALLYVQQRDFSNQFAVAQRRPRRGEPGARSICDARHRPRRAVRGPPAHRPGRAAARRGLARRRGPGAGAVPVRRRRADPHPQRRRPFRHARRLRRAWLDAAGR